MWASFSAALTELLRRLAPFLVPLLAYWKGKSDEAKARDLAQAEANTEKAGEYLRNHSDGRSPDDVVKRMQDGTF